ncbi:MAG: sugar phosphate isomerase/epimerase family protein [Phycisphaerae bacterium]
MLRPVSLSTWCFLEQQSGPRLAGVVEQIVSAGFGVEFWWNWRREPNALARPSWDDWKARTDGAAVITVHTKNDRQAVHEELDFLAHVGGRALVIHPALVWRQQDHTAPDEPWLAELLRHATDEGLYIALENIHPDDTVLLERCVERFGPPGREGGFGICLDIGHCVSCEPELPQPVQSLFESFAGAIVTMHVHEVYGQTGHCLPGEPGGRVPWADLVQAMRRRDFSAIGTLEINMPRTHRPVQTWLAGLQEAASYFKSHGLLG